MSGWHGAVHPAVEDGYFLRKGDWVILAKTSFQRALVYLNGKVEKG